MSPTTSSKALAILALSSMVAASPVVLEARQTAPYLGCYTEAYSSRALASASTANGTTMTPAECEAFCLPTYSLYGVEYGSECYCGNTLESGSVKVAETDCNMACAGDATKICGAGNRLSVYGDAAALPPSSNPGTPPPVSATYLGCRTEGNGTRALTGSTLVIGTMTLEVCANHCYNVHGFILAGLEYGSECYCGNALDASSAVAPEPECNMPCAGNSTQICGAGDRLSVWQKV